MEDSKDTTYRILRRTTRFGPGRRRTVTYKYKSEPKSDLQLEEEVFDLIEKVIDTYKQMSREKQHESSPRIQSRLETLSDRRENPLTKVRINTLD
ncbi:hypothetical protein GCM10007938_24870 [Vibrio zhanjiangensis]|uniref:Transposase n=1 Tax=Vibrio zhanjiangensis TaxID=1046128 RepID=A0ABQ6F1E8_9VIBR|nr:hypothetical protein [Vibrio zhanjiangensis]GLT18706.1 hypothetical protein GCM10007938_24870 [Vibrio zhanjiangensis]